mmetsp:Transcript_12942/g.30859  ORF Transcript_12942/g.30859 Transcript_12942/m.30859 type:complete len:219 (-) Transcript_12942:903-1559(-)
MYGTVHHSTNHLSRPEACRSWAPRHECLSSLTHHSPKNVCLFFCLSVCLSCRYDGHPRPGQPFFFRDFRIHPQPFSSPPLAVSRQGLSLHHPPPIRPQTLSSGTETCERDEILLCRPLWPDAAALGGWRRAEGGLAEDGNGVLGGRHRSPNGSLVHPPALGSPLPLQIGQVARIGFFRCGSAHGVSSPVAGEEPLGKGWGRWHQETHSWAPNPHPLLI